MMIAQMKLETPEISEEVISESHNMSGLSPMDQLLSAGESSMDQFFNVDGDKKQKNTMYLTNKHTSLKQQIDGCRNVSEFHKKKMH